MVKLRSVYPKKSNRALSSCNLVKKKRPLRDAFLKVNILTCFIVHLGSDKRSDKKGEPLHSRKSTTNYLRKEALMYKFMQIKKFAKVIFDTDKAAQKASKIMEGILQSQSPRISDVADQMAGNEAANYKMIQRFLFIIA